MVDYDNVEIKHLLWPMT